LTDTSIPALLGVCPPIKNTERKHPTGQSSTHTSGGNPLFLHPLAAAPSMESGSHLGRIRFDLKLQNVCDRSEDRLASMVPLLSVLIGQPTSPLG